MYWKIIPANKRNLCIFKESCSKIVYRYAIDKGSTSALKIFIYRYKNCRPGYHLFLKNNQIHLMTVKKNIIEYQNINPSIIKEK